MSVFVGGPSRTAQDHDSDDSDVTYDPLQGPPPKRRAVARRAHTAASSGNSSSSSDESKGFTPRDAAKLRLVREKVTEALSAPEGDKYVFVEVSSRPNRWDFELLNSVCRFDASNETFELSDGTVVELENVPDKGVRTVLRRPDGSQDTFGVVRFLGSGETEPIAEFIWHS